MYSCFQLRIIAETLEFITKKIILDKLRSQNEMDFPLIGFASKWINLTKSFLLKNGSHFLPLCSGPNFAEK